MVKFIHRAVGRPLALAAVAILVGVPSSPADGAQPEPLRLSPQSPQVQQAAQRAGKWLLAKQLPSGNWTFSETGGDSYDLGVTALAGLALVESGIPTNHPSIQKAAQYLRTELARKSSYTAIFTYEAATVTLFLGKLNEPGDTQLLVSQLGAIRNAQKSDGGWGYYVTTGSGADAEKQRAGSDNSNTQFAVIALLAGRDRIVGVDDVLERAALRFLNSQGQARAGWGYKGDFAPSVSMTAAGLIAIGAAHACDRVPAELVLGGAEKQQNLALVNTPVGRALAMIERDLPLHMTRSRDLIANKGQRPSGPSSTVRGVTVDYTTGKAKEATFSTGGGGYVSPEGRVDFYELWSIERVAVAFNLDAIGSLDWYTAGATLLLASQQPDGNWKYHRDGAVASTAFGLLFLSKANLAPAISTKIATSPGLNTPKPERLFRCGWVKSQPRGPAWRLTFSVSSADEYLRIVEKLGGTLVVGQGAAAFRFEKPASDPTKSQRERWTTWERRSDVWQHIGPEILAELKTPLSVSQADRIVLLLPNSVTRQIQTSAAKMKPNRSNTGEVIFSLSSDPATPLTADAIDADELRLTLQPR
jgi:hypothetical protein